MLYREYLHLRRPAVLPPGAEQRRDDLPAGGGGVRGRGTGLHLRKTASCLMSQRPRQPQTSVRQAGGVSPFIAVSGSRSQVDGDVPLTRVSRRSGRADPSQPRLIVRIKVPRIVQFFTPDPTQYRATAGPRSSAPPGRRSSPRWAVFPRNRSCAVPSWDPESLFAQRPKGSQHCTHFAAG